MNLTMNENGNVMNYGYFGAIDYVIFVLMLGISMAVGIYFGCFEKSVKSTEEYLLGGRKMKTFPIAISLIASQLSAISIMAIPAEMYSFGTQYAMIIPSMVFVTLIVTNIFVPVFYSNRLSNCYEYLEMRFDSTLRQLITALFIISIFLVIPIFIFTPALAFSQVTGVNIHLINTIVCAICVFYTMLGGIKAVVWTDVIQGSIMFGSCFLIVGFGVAKVGGFEEVIGRAAAGNRLQFFNMSFDLTTRQTFWNIMLGCLCLWSPYIGLNQSCVQRIIALPSITHAKNSLFIFCIGYFIIMVLNCFTGLVMYARYFDCDPILAKVVEKADKLVPFFVQDVVGHLYGMSGVFISCVFSAGLSTMSASMNSLSGVIYTDYIKPIKKFHHTEIKANFIMKTIVVIIGVYSVLMGFFVEKFGSILQLVMTVSSVSNGTTLGVFLLGMLWPWSNKRGALCGAIVSFITVSWIIIGSQIMIRRGELFYKPLNTTIDGCDAFGFNVSLSNISTIASSPAADESFSIYKIAFAWYAVIGTILVWIVGVPVSYLTGSQDMRQAGFAKLISPIAVWMLPEEIRETELQMQLKLVEKEAPLDGKEKQETEWVWKSGDDNDDKLEK